MLKGKLGGLPVRIYLIKYGRNTRWNIMLSTDVSMPFVRAFELYQIRWNIEVVNKETKEYLGLGSYIGRDLDGQIADATLCYITYIVMSLEKRVSEYDTMGQLFGAMEEEVMSLTLWRRVLRCLERVLDVLGDRLGYSIDELAQVLIDDPETREDYMVMADALMNRQLSQHAA